MAPVILVDGSSYFYRAFHALPPLSNSQGFPTGAIHGVVNMVRKLLKDYKPSHMAVVFDAKGRTFRDEIYSEYKANRPPMPEELALQSEPLKSVIRAMGIPLLEVSGVEADDVIGTLARQSSEQKMEMIISTGDKDMAQLVNDKVTLLNTMSKTSMDVAGVEEKFGVGPELIIDYLALIGDKVDNVPGVPSVGPKTAVKWLKAYDNVDGIIAHQNDIPGKVGEQLRNHLEQLALSKKLVRIHDQVELEVGVKELLVEKPDTAKLIELTTELELNTWRKELEKSQDVSPKPDKPKKVKYETVLDMASLDKWIKKLSQAKLLALDTETSDLNYMKAELVGLSFSVKSGEACYIPLAHDYEGAPVQLDKKAVLDKLKPLLTDEAIAKLGHHIKYDINILSHEGISLAGVRYDSMLESYVWNSSSNRHDMDTLAHQYLNHTTTTFEEVAGKGVKQKTFNQVELETAAPYAAEDADITYRLHETLHEKLLEQPDLLKVLTDIEMPLVSVLSKMETTGVLIDARLLQGQSDALGSELTDIMAQAYELAGAEFNLNSPKQLIEILYEKLSLPVIKKTPKGKPSTAEPVLQQLAQDYELPSLILTYRSLSKLKSTYTDKLPLQISERTGRIHTSYNQAVTSTGRLSSTDPNLQNIPVRTENGRRIRQAFIAPKGKKMVAADYSQIELRIMAHLSGDESLLHAFANDLDIHQFTASEVFHVPLDEVDAEMRRHAKAINFGLIYGMSAFGLARELQIERGEAQNYMDWYFNKYPGVKAYMEEVVDSAKKKGHVQTIFGRRLMLPDIHAKNFQVRSAAERAAINAPMQGSAADIIKIAMIEVDSALSKTKWDATMIMQVHDELVFEVAEKDVDDFVSALPTYMCQCVELKVPLKVSIGIGDNWDEAH